jgi:hypothetical protein
MLTNICCIKKPFHLIGIGGKQTAVEKEGDLLGYGPVYFHQEANDDEIF